MLRPVPTGFLQFGLFWVVVAIGGAALIRAFAGKGGHGDTAKRSNVATVGIVLQAVAFGLVGFGPIRFALPWTAPAALICSALVVLFGGLAIAIFSAATKAMGKNWSVVARTRADHQLVRSGPFALVRHPIYLALLLYMLSFGVGFGHVRQLVVAVPIYLLGATIRVREEEKLLSAQFGDAHATYVREVPAFLPYIRR